MKNKWFIFRCKCCGATFYKTALEITGFKESALTVLDNDTVAIHICDKSTSLNGIGELIGAANYGYES